MNVPTYPRVIPPRATALHPTAWMGAEESPSTHAPLLTKLHGSQLPHLEGRFRACRLGKGIWDAWLRIVRFKADYGTSLWID